MARYDDLDMDGNAVTNCPTMTVSGQAIPTSASGLFFPANQSGTITVSGTAIPTSASGLFFPANLSGVISSGQILSGHIASGQIGINHLSSGLASGGWSVSGSITPGIPLSASGLFFPANQSGSITISGTAIPASQSGTITVSGTAIPTSASGLFFPANASGLWSGSVWSSGSIASGQIGINHLSSGLASGNFIASGQAIPANQSGTITVSGTAIPTSASGLFYPANASGLWSGSVWSSGSIASGQISRMHLSSGSVNSGHTASGVVSTWANQTLLNLTTIETISGGRSVSITASGRAQIAMTTLSGRMPAIGYTVVGALSGTVVEIITQGLATPASGINNTRPGRPVFVGASGFVGNISGGFLSGGFAMLTAAASSGALCQVIGYATNSGQVYINPQIPVTSGLPLLPVHAL